MGVVVTVKEKGLMEATAMISGFGKRAVDLTIPMKQASLLMLASVNKNFQMSGRPTSWVPLAASTLKEKIRKGYSTRPLIRTGFLRQSITAQSGRMEMRLGTAIRYGRIHEYGGRAGRGGSANIPARPYLLFQREDLDRIRKMILSYLTTGEMNA